MWFRLRHRWLSEAEATFTIYKRNMKNTLIIILLSFLSATCFAQQNIVSDKMRDQILKDVQKNRAYLIDVRTLEEYKTGHLKDSKNIDFHAADFKTQIAKLDKNKTVYLYCRSGNRSGKAADTLKALGFQKYYNIGGFEALKTAGLPAE